MSEASALSNESSWNGATEAILCLQVNTQRCRNDFFASHFLPQIGTSLWADFSYCIFAWLAPPIAPHPLLRVRNHSKNRGKEKSLKCVIGYSTSGEKMKQAKASRWRVAFIHCSGQHSVFGAICVDMLFAQLLRHGLNSRSGRRAEQAQRVTAGTRMQVTDVNKFNASSQLGRYRNPSFKASRCQPDKHSTLSTQISDNK